MIQSIDKHKNFTKVLKNPMGTQRNILYIDHYYNLYQSLNYVVFASKSCTIVWNIDNFTVAGYSYSDKTCTTVTMCKLCMNSVIVAYDNGLTYRYGLVQNGSMMPI